MNFESGPIKELKRQTPTGSDIRPVKPFFDISSIIIISAQSDLPIDTYAILTDDLASRLVFQNAFPAGLVFLTFAEVLLVLSSYLLQVLWMRDGPTDYGRAGRTTDYQTDESDLADLMDQDFSFLFDDENFFVLLHDQSHVLMMQLF